MAEKFCKKSSRSGGENVYEKFCGVWGQIREEFLKTHKHELYNSLIEKGELENYLQGYQTAYSNRAEKMAEELSAKRGINPELLKMDSLEWILESEKVQEEVRAKFAEEICI